VHTAGLITFDGNQPEVAARNAICIRPPLETFNGAILHPEARIHVTEKSFGVKRKVLVSSFSHLATDPHVQRRPAALQGEHDVVAGGSFLRAPVARTSMILNIARIVRSSNLEVVPDDFTTTSLAEHRNALPTEGAAQFKRNALEAAKKLSAETNDTRFLEIVRRVLARDGSHPAPRP